MLRNSEDCNQRIYSREQTRVSDNVIALSLLLMHLRDTEAICLTYWSSFMQNHQPHILSIHNGKYLTLQLTTLVLKHKAQAIVTIFSLEFSGSTGQISQWKTALPSITSKPRKKQYQNKPSSSYKWVEVAWEAGKEVVCSTLPDAISCHKSLQTHFQNSSFHTLIFLNSRM